MMSMINSINLLFVVAIHDLNPEYIISDDDKDFITTYLYSIEEWTEYELYILAILYKYYQIVTLYFLASLL